MSVLQYIYPQHTECLNLDSLRPAWESGVPDIKIVEVEPNRRAAPNWTSLLIRHPASRKIESLFAVSQNDRTSVRELSQRYNGSKMDVARNARQVIWAQLKAPLSVSDERLVTAIHIHNSLISVLMRLCNGVVHLPENEKLYSAVGFTAYVKKSRSQYCA